MHKSQIALGVRWKWHFQAARFQNFPGEHAPHPLILPLLRHCFPVIVNLDFSYTKQQTTHTLNH